MKTSELEKLQEKKLRAIIKYAYENTKFYHHKFRDADIRPDDIKTIDDLKKIPFTTKTELRENSLGLMLARDVDLKKCRMIYTSGSTGTPIKIVYDKFADDYSKAVNLRSMMENGLQIRDKAVNIGDTRVSENQTWFQKLGFFNLTTLNIFDDIEKQVTMLKRMDPDVITGYPSQLNIIARYIKKHRIIGIKPKTVFATAELLDDKTRKLINDVFNVELIDLFGCIEVNRTAWECSKHQGYHLDVDSVIVEFIRGGEDASPGERGEIVYTCLFNYAMPLIRYKVGDIGIPSDELCSCGRGLPMMKSVEGRCDDFVCLPSGKLVSPRIFSLEMRYFDDIIEYQIVQNKIDEISGFLVVSEGFNEESINEIGKNFERILDNEVSMKIQICNSIKRSSNGKIKKVTSKIKQ